MVSEPRKQSMAWMEHRLQISLKRFALFDGRSNGGFWGALRTMGEITWTLSAIARKKLRSVLLIVPVDCWLPKQYGKWKEILNLYLGVKMKKKKKTLIHTTSSVGKLNWSVLANFRQAFSNFCWNHWDFHSNSQKCNFHKAKTLVRTGNGQFYTQDAAIPSGRTWKSQSVLCLQPVTHVS